MGFTRTAVIFMLIGTLMLSVPILMAWPIPPRAEQMLNLVLGFFLAKGGDAVAYLLNSTAGSNAKTDAVIDMAAQHRRQPQPVTVENKPDNPVPVTDEFAIPDPPK